MKIGWGWKIMALYGAFVLMIAGLVTASSRQKIDLVSPDYYKQEIGYQAVLNANKNQSALSATPRVYATATEVVVELPAELEKKVLAGNIHLYAPVNKDWDKNIEVKTSRITIPRSTLQKIVYELKISYSADGKEYYYETRLDLHQS